MPLLVGIASVRPAAMRSKHATETEVRMRMMKMLTKVVDKEDVGNLGPEILFNVARRGRVIYAALGRIARCPRGFRTGTSTSPLVRIPTSPELNASSSRSH